MPWLSWYVNVGKRLVKSPKIYLRDSGLFHTLQNICDTSELVDLSSYDCMRRLGIQRAIAFDKLFLEQGFHTPEHPAW